MYNIYTMYTKECPFTGHQSAVLEIRDTEQQQQQQQH